MVGSLPLRQVSIGKLKIVQAWWPQIFFEGQQQFFDQKVNLKLTSSLKKNTFADLMISTKRANPLLCRGGECVNFGYFYFTHFPHLTKLDLVDLPPGFGAGHRLPTQQVPLPLGSRSSSHKSSFGVANGALRGKEFSLISVTNKTRFCGKWEKCSCQRCAASQPA